VIKTKPMIEQSVELKVVDDEEKLMEYITIGGYGYIRSTYNCACSENRTAYLLTFVLSFTDLVVVCPKCYKRCSLTRLPYKRLLKRVKTKNDENKKQKKKSLGS
jgi:hypothetical protein